MFYRLSRGQKIFNVVNCVFLLLLACVCFYPFWFVIIASLSEPTQMNTTYIWPKEFYIKNYWIVFGTTGILRAYLISVLRVAIAVPLMLLVTGAAAFVLSRKELMFRRTIIIYFFITMFFSGGLIPYYLTVKTVGLLNTFWVYVVPVLFSVWSMIVMKTSIQSLPEGLVEAALMDGSSYVRIFWQIILPLSTAMLAVLGLFSAVGHWNDWFVGAFYVSNRKLRPLQTFLQLEVTRAANQALFSQIGEFGIDQGWEEEELWALMNNPKSLVLAYIVVATVPIMLVYPFLQRYFTRGVLIGSLKE